MWSMRTPWRCGLFGTVMKQNKARFSNGARAVQMSSFSVIAALAVGLTLSGCATKTTDTQTPLASSEAGVGVGQRDLTPEEKKVIADAVAPPCL
jgi:hypothetical protein